MRFFIVLIFIGLVTVYPALSGISHPCQITADSSLVNADRSFDQNDYANALLFYESAVKDFKAQNQWKGYEKAMAGKAHTLIKLRKYENARAALDTALSVGKRFMGETIEIATVYYVYGVLHDLMNKPDQSLAMHKNALRIRKASLGPQHFKVAESFNGIGEVYRYTVRDYFEAEKNFLQAIEILEHIGNADQKHLYRGYYNLATTNRLKNDFEKALAFAFQAVQALESIKPSDTISFIRCYGIIANIYNTQSVFEKAISYYRKALALRIARREMSSEMANDYKNLAKAYIESGQVPKALLCVDSALMIVEQDAYYDSAELANIHLIKGKALRESKRDEEAIQSYRLSLYIHKHNSRSNALDMSNAYMHLSETMNKIQQYDSALFYIQKSIECVMPQGTKLVNWANPSYKMLEHKPQLYDQLTHKGVVLTQLARGKNSVGTLKLALECFNLSDQLMEIFWNSQDRENSKLNFVNINYHINELALTSIFNLHHLTSDESYKAEAFELMDKSKARILRQKVEEVGAQARLKIPDSLLSQERHIKSEITALQNKLAALKKSEQEERILGTEMIVKEKELDAWRKKMKNLFPQYSFAPKDPSLMTLIELKNKLSKDITFIEYFFGEKTIYVFASLAGQQHFIRIENKNISSKIYQFCGLLSRGLKSKNLESDFKEYTHLAFSLYTDLLTPVFEALNLDIENEHPKILIIPDGALNLLPFQALITLKPKNQHSINYKNLNYLVKRSTISYSYDAASLFATSHPTAWGKNLLAFGWSDGTENNYDAHSLPGTYKELQSVAAIMPGKFMMGEEARKKSFLDLASGYNILHLAIHGKADNADIYNNYLQFQDEKLFAHELYGLRLNANNLTVLSACETGYGKVFNAEGVYNIARGFFYAGSKGLLMTLWPIDDRATASLIPEFYKNLNKQDYVSTALRKSQLDYLQKADELSAHPSYWAGLVLWGMHKEIGERNIISTKYVIPCVILLAALCLLMFFKMRKKVS